MCRVGQSRAGVKSRARSAHTTASRRGRGAPGVGPEQPLRRFRIRLWSRQKVSADGPCLKSRIVAPPSVPWISAIACATTVRAFPVLGTTHEAVASPPAVPTLPYA